VQIVSSVVSLQIETDKSVIRLFAFRIRHAFPVSDAPSPHLFTTMPP
jgi:hypothetical protein